MSCQPGEAADPTPDPTPSPTPVPDPTPDPTPAPTSPPVEGGDLSGNLMFATNTGVPGTWTPSYITKDNFGETREPTGSSSPNKKMTYHADESSASETAQGTGNCAYSNVQNLEAFDIVDGWVAVSKAKRYEHSLACGMCVEYRGLGGVNGDVDNPISATWQKAMVVDSCEACENAAGKELVELQLKDGEGDGSWEIQWKAVECSVGSGKFQYVFAGSSDWNIKFQIRNTKVPIRKVEMKGRKNVLDVTSADSEYKYYEMRRSDDNHFLADQTHTPDLALHWARPYGKYIGAVVGSEWGTYEPKLELRITSIFGEVVDEEVDFQSGDHLKTLTYLTPIAGNVQFDAGQNAGAGRRIDDSLELRLPHW